MKLGLQLPTYTWPGGPAQIGPHLARLAHAADDAGFESIWVMDHFFQIPGLGAVDQEMLESYTTLAFLAAHTSRARLGTMVTGVMYRHPGILAKVVATLDVLSGGRANLGIGAGWFEQEHLGLGVPFPPPRERFERLEETLQIVLQMWSDNNGPYRGAHYQLAETISGPKPLSQPHPPILVGGGGEQRTLRLVARYANAWNLIGRLPAEDIRRKMDVLRQHCRAEGRDFAAIHKTVLYPHDPGADAAAILDQLQGYVDLGFETAIASVVGATLPIVEFYGSQVIPKAARLTPTAATG